MEQDYTVLEQQEEIDQATANLHKWLDNRLLDNHGVQVPLDLSSQVYAISPTNYYITTEDGGRYRINVPDTSIARLNEPLEEANEKHDHRGTVQHDHATYNGDEPETVMFMDDWDDEEKREKVKQLPGVKDAAPWATKSGEYKRNRTNEELNAHNRGKSDKTRDDGFYTIPSDANESQQQDDEHIRAYVKGPAPKSIILVESIPDSDDKDTELKELIDTQDVKDAVILADDPGVVNHLVNTKLQVVPTLEAAYNYLYK